MARKRLVAIAVLGVVGCSGSGNPTGGDHATPALTLSSPSFTLQPGEELFRCWYTTIDSAADLQAVRMHSTMSPGSHHFIVYTTQNPLRPDGTFEDCAKRAGGTSLRDTPVWLYATQDPEAELQMPSGTALPLRSKQPVYFDMHYINATTSPMTVQVKLDVESQSGTFQKVGAYVTYNTQIDIPPGGTQTVSGDCDVPAGAQFFTMSTHSHKRTVDAMATRGSAAGEMLVHTTDWEHATITNWAAPAFLTFAAGEKLHYQCSYKNDSANPIKEGESAEKNEMCMAVGYYFPATNGSFCLDSTIYNF
jgi:Copper type II ascorbate-dependent monooxygenase, C-terminal domain